MTLATCDTLIHAMQAPLDHIRGLAKKYDNQQPTGVAPMSKIYRVSSTVPGLTARLVRANNRQAAVNFVARDTLVGNLATQDELVLAITAGTKIEDASSHQLDMLDMLDDTLKQDKPVTASEVLERRQQIEAFCNDKDENGNSVVAFTGGVA